MPRAGEEPREQQWQEATVTLRTEETVRKVVLAEARSFCGSWPGGGAPLQELKPQRKGSWRGSRVAGDTPWRREELGSGEKHLALLVLPPGLS